MESIQLTVELRRFAAGDVAAAHRIFPLVYPNLHEVARLLMARQPVDHTLQATALVHEAFLKLAGSGAAGDINDRKHFFRLAGRAMRQALVDHARRRSREKRPPTDRRLVDVALDGFVERHRDYDLVDLNDCLDRLGMVNEDAVAMVELRFFSGFSKEDAAGVLGLSRRDADRTWHFARTFLSAGSS